jgi:hypothetical protein
MKLWKSKQREQSVEENGQQKNGKEAAPERARDNRYYQHDGALQAYANRAMLLAFLCVPTTLIAVALAAYVRLQPPTVIRVDQDGHAAVVGGRSGAVTVAQGAAANPDALEREAFVRSFLDRYLNFTPESVNRNWAEALNMMSVNRRQATLKAMTDDNSAGKVQDDQITSVFHLRSVETAKDDPLTFTVFGVKDIHKVRDHRESSEKLVVECHVRLVPEQRSEANATGLLIAEFGEKLITGERADAVAQQSTPESTSQ